jgi:hypothetical protein
MKPDKPQETKSTIRFNATLVPFKQVKPTFANASASRRKAGSWTVLTFPKSASAKLPSRGSMMVEGTINCLPFRAALEPSGTGTTHDLKVSNAMREAVGATAGDMVTLEITRVGEEPETRMPMDLRKALAGIPLAQKSWLDITPMARRDWIFSISSSKLPETRRRRILKARDMLASGKRRLCCFPGIKWMMKENAKTCGMWLPLSNPTNRSSPRSTKQKITKARKFQNEPIAHQ